MLQLLRGSKSPRPGPVVLGLLSALLLAGAMLAPQRALSGELQPSAFGVLHSVDGHGLHLYCLGSGSPTVILEAGLGGNHLDWIRAQPEIAKITRTCSYDRAGYGWSEPGPKPRTAESISGELHALLREAGITGPLVMVGHSFGGMLSLYFSRRYAAEVAGLVLIDSMHPDQYEAFEEAGIDVPTEPTRAVINSTREVMTFGIPEDYKDLAYDLARRDTARSFMSNELRNVRITLEQVKGIIGDPAIPAEVIVHGRREWDRIYSDGRMENLWLKLQADLARQVGARRLVVSDKSGHQVPLEDPGLVAKVVGLVIAKVRAGRR